ncbi:putative FAD-dependent monooxygenase [Zalerion maritima]|uniref:FAD-dependent monooxygenase n=1 Tax=Zalerion maritima TaxID=339359 RepID=A0AAD5RM93_9PEZI|nr:putative FAD-dependent monooxygenase [Zalerion maritima]
MTATLPVIIAGAGISGLLLAQHLHMKSIPFEIYERDTDMTTRGIGWGLTLHWSLPALRVLLPEDIFSRLPETNINQAAYKAGRESRFPFYDLSTGELQAATPQVPQNPRIRVGRQKLRELLATGIDVKWGKAVKDFTDNKDNVTVTFDDETTTTGRLLVGCDSRSSRIRRRICPDHEPYRIPIRVMGCQFFYPPEKLEGMGKLDPFFLQGTASENDSFMYFSVLDSPGNAGNTTGKYNCQVCVSWPFREGFFGSSEPTEMPPTKETKTELVRKLAATWKDPFRSFVLGIPEDTEFIGLDLTDFPPPKGLRSQGRVTLMGDAIHAMAMYRGEGANHAIVDVLEFSQKVTPLLVPIPRPDVMSAASPAGANVRSALDEYEDGVVKRTRPGVLASRRACLDAHDFARIGKTSPLLSKRAMLLDSDEEEEE